MDTKQTVHMLQNTNNIYKRNMEALKARDISLYNRIMALPEQNDYILYRESPNEPQNLISLSRQLTYYEVDDTIERVEKQIDDLKLKNTRIAVFLGIGLGYELIYYINYIMKAQKTDSILIIEKDLQVFKKALEATLMVEIFEEKKIEILVGEDDERSLFLKLHNFFDTYYRMLLVKCINYIYTDGIFRFDKDYYINIINTIKEAINYTVVNYGNSIYDSLIGLSNTIKNIDYIANNPGIDNLFDKFKNKPAIVISTGPSLDKSIEYLKGLEDKALLLAPDNSLKVLKKNGIKPHIVTSIERVNWVEKLYRGYTEEDLKDIYLVTPPIMQQKVYENYVGPKMMMYRSYNYLKWLQVERGIMKVSRSAGNMCFNIAQMLGCDPIILIGQDLSYTSDGKTHADDAAFKEGTEEEMQEAIKKNEYGEYMRVKGNYEDLVYTSESFYSFLQDYELDVKKYKGLCINATEGGAYIAGTKLMHFPEAIEKYVDKKFYPIEIIKNKLKYFNKVQAEKDLDTLYKVVNDTLKDLDEMLEIMNRMKNTIDENIEYIYSLYGKEEISKDEKDEIETTYKILGNCFEEYRLKPVYNGVVLDMCQSYELNFKINFFALDGLDESEDKIKIRKWLEFAKYNKSHLLIIQKIKDTIIEALDYNCFEEWDLNVVDLYNE